MNARDDDGFDEGRQISLCETLDRVLNKGVVVAGEVVISVAGIDLIYLNLRLLLTNVEVVNQNRREAAMISLGGGQAVIAELNDPTIGLDNATLSDFARVLSAPGPVDKMQISIDPEDVKKGLGKLVLTVVELLRELLERQAIRRMEAGSLTEDEVERLGTTFLQLSEQMEVLKGAFGILGEDLNIDLGPLGKLL